MNLKDNEKAIRKAILIFNERTACNLFEPDKLIDEIQRIGVYDESYYKGDNKFKLPYDLKKNFYARMLEIFFEKTAMNINSNKNSMIENKYYKKYFSELNSLCSGLADILYEKDIIDNPNTTLSSNIEQYEISKKSAQKDSIDVVKKYGFTEDLEYIHKIKANHEYTSSSCKTNLKNSLEVLGFADLNNNSKEIRDAIIKYKALEARHNDQNSFMKLISFREKKLLKEAKEALMNKLHILDPKEFEIKINSKMEVSTYGKQFENISDEKCDKKCAFNYLENMKQTVSAEPTNINSYESFMNAYKFKDNYKKIIKDSYDWLKSARDLNLPDISEFALNFKVNSKDNEYLSQTVSIPQLKALTAFQKATFLYENPVPKADIEQFSIEDFETEINKDSNIITTDNLEKDYSKDEIIIDNVK